MTTYTPGPWALDNDMRGLGNLRVAGVRSATASIANCGTDGVANARLIAAAPDLLDALRWALGQIEDDLDPGHQAALTAARAALAAATGEA